MTYQLPPAKPPVVSTSQKAAPKPFLTDAQVGEKCQYVPVFVLLDNVGTPLTVTLPGKKPTVGIFFGKKEADAFCQQIIKQNPKLTTNVKPTMVTLSNMVSLARKSLDVIYAFVPSGTAVKEAKELLVAQGKKATDLQGTPLFLIRRADNSTGSKNVKSPPSVMPNYIMIQSGNDKAIPCFFSKKEAEALIQKFQQQDSKTKLILEVATMEGILHLLQTSPDSQIKLITLILSAEMRDSLPKPAEASPPTAKPPDNILPSDSNE